MTKVAASFFFQHNPVPLLTIPYAIISRNGGRLTAGLGQQRELK